MVRGEYINGNTGHYDVDENGDLVLNDWLSKGYYGVLGYNFKIGNQKLMPVLRYEHFTKDEAVVNGGTAYYTVGINYWPVKSLNFKLDYSLIQPETGDKSHRVVGILSYKF